MYRRSYDYTITPEQKEEFIKNILYYTGRRWHYIIGNDYPYDMCRDKKVKTKHEVMFFYEYNDDVIGQIKEYNSLWYSVQINSTEHQSIPEIQHLHFIKIIDE
jgi:hypothetical protein